MKRLSIVTMIAAFATAAFAAEDYPKAQLPDSVVPQRYALELTILPDQETFQGHTTIDVTVAEPTAAIWMHAQDMTVSAASVVDSSGRTLPAKLEEIPGSGGVARLSTASPMASGAAKISITYTAPFNRRLESLYRTDEAGESYAFSQMEPIFARGAFPSFDEPRFKTPFDMTLTVREAHVAVSNTPIAREEKMDGGLKRLTFMTSKPLPTYLIAFAVGPLDVVEWKPIRKTALRDREIPLRGIAAKGKGKMFTYALENTEPLLVILEDYFGIPYPYEKLDLIAAVDFAAGAMENAGAIAYRESLMLFDENPSLSQKRRYVLTHAHEMAHQWFGNLVTPAWWNDIWLNEAFATWMEYRTAREFDPKGEYGRLSLTGSLGAMRSDSWRSARRVANPVENNDDISNAFDGITYDKGGGVLSMFERFYGAEAFRRGVQLHMKRFEFGIATSRDFMQSIADASGGTGGVSAFESFLNQAGVPTVRAEVSCRSSEPAVVLTQSRYAARVEEPRSDQNWKIPMCIAVGGRTYRNGECAILTERVTRLPLNSSTCPTWVMPNEDGAGYFRFSLDRKGWGALFANIGALNPSERLATLDSLDAAFTSGAVDIDTYTAGIKALLATKPSMPEWDAVVAPIGRLTWIADRLVQSEHRKNAVATIMNIYSPIFDQVGLTPTNPADARSPVQAILMRVPLAGLMGLDLDRADVRDELAARGAAYLGLDSDGVLNPRVIDPSLVETAMAATVRSRGMAAYEAIAGHLKSERSAVVRSRLIAALTRTQDPGVAARVRDLALSPDLRVNEVPMIVYGALREPPVAADGWDWFKRNFDAIVERTPPNNRGDLAEIGARFCSKAERNDYAKFFEPRIAGLTGGPRVMAQALEQIDACRTLVDKQRRKAEKFFASPDGSNS